MKILHVSSSTVFGGNEIQLLEIIPELENLNVSNIVLLKSGSYLESECLQRKINFIAFEKFKKYSFNSIKYFKSLLKEVNPDIIHFHTSDFLTIYVFTDFLYNLNTPTVYSRKSMIKSESFIGKIRYNYKNLNAIICVSENVKNNLKEKLTYKNKDKLNVIYDCVPLKKLAETTDENLRETYKISDDVFIIGNIANHNKAKDLQTFVKIVDYVVNEKKINNLFFVQIGEFSNLTESLVAFVNEKKINNHIVFTGRKSNAYRYNNQFDIFLMCSEREGGPTVLLEAMYVNKPIVATNVGIVPELIKNKVNGYISEPKDYVSMANNIIELISNEEIRKNIVIGNSDVINKNNCSSNIALKTLNLYNKLLQK